jgi:hypothetical protein
MVWSLEKWPLRTNSEKYESGEGRDKRRRGWGSAHLRATFKMLFLAQHALSA